jgi:Bacterial Ig domain
MSKASLFVCAVATAGFVAVGAFAASADCITRGGRFFPAQNDTITARDLITNNGTCRHPGRASGRLVFTGVSILSKPNHGTLSQGTNSVTYTPAAAFKGQDSYTLKVCGETSGGKGCSTITYDTTVQ